MQKTPIHTTYFLSGKKSYYLDLMKAKSNKLYIQLAMGRDLGAHTCYSRMILFEDDWQEFIQALCEVMEVYIGKQQSARKNIRP